MKLLNVLCVRTEAHATMCCRQDLRQALHEDTRNPACYPIEIPEHDPVYSKAGIRCMEFVRTTNDVSQGCNSGNKPAEQVTDFIDL
jgi:peroxidase